MTESLVTLLLLRCNFQNPVTRVRLKSYVRVPLPFRSVYFAAGRLRKGTDQLAYIHVLCGCASEVALFALTT